MLTLDQKLLIDRLDAYITYCESQGFTRSNYSTYFISFKEQRMIDSIKRLNIIQNLNLPFLGNKYKYLTLICHKIKQEDAKRHEQSVLDAVGGDYE